MLTPADFALVGTTQSLQIRAYYKHYRPLYPSSTSSSESIDTLEIRIVDPCDYGTFSLNPHVIPSEITYDLLDPVTPPD